MSSIDDILWVRFSDLKTKTRAQHPKVQEKKGPRGSYWFFRYWEDQANPDGSYRSIRKKQAIGPSKGADAISKKEAEIERDKLLATINVPVGVAAAKRTEDGQRVIEKPLPLGPGVMLFGKLAAVWLSDYVERSVGGRHLLAAPTRAKYVFQLKKYILPRWSDTRLDDFKAKDILDWLMDTCESWHHIADLRNIMSGIVTKSKEWEYLPQTFSLPKVKLPKQWEVRESRILDDDETSRVFSRLDGAVLMITEICLSTGTRISEATGLKVKHFDAARGSIKIEQRHWRGDIDEPKTAKSKRVLALGDLTPRLSEWISQLKHHGPEAWIFPQEDDHRKPMWDSGVRKALKLAAHAEGCDFPGFGPHSLRRANITMRQEVGGSSIEASQIAGHASTKITEKYTVIQLRRQDELTRRIQGRLAKAKRAKTKVVAIKKSEVA